jgi:O-antigen/teichoic acid export membrane protein
VYGAAIAAIIGTGASGLVALKLASSLFRSAPSTQGAISYRVEARRLLTYSASISGYDLINALIVRLDVIMLGCFVGRAPGVTLATVGIYGAVVEVASGLRKVNQAFNPIFGPLIAGMTANGDQGHAATTFSRVAQWMLWILLPLFAVMVFAGPLILSIYGADFRQGAIWLGIVALACGTNCFVGLAETVIMVQRPGINLLNSTITCVVAVVANLVLINSLGATGAAFGILLPYVLLGILRHRTLRLVFGWERPWSNVAPPVIAMGIAVVPAIICRLLLHGVAAQIVSAALFLLVFGDEWWFHFRRPARR